MVSDCDECLFVGMAGRTDDAVRSVVVHIPLSDRFVGRVVVDIIVTPSAVLATKDAQVMDDAHLRDAVQAMRENARSHGVPLESEALRLATFD